MKMISEWNTELGRQVDREATVAELLDLESLTAGPSFEVQKAEYLTEVRALRERILGRLSGVGTQLMLAEPPVVTEAKEACGYLMQALLDITSIPSVTEAETLHDLKAAVKAEYARLVAYANAAYPILVRTFKQVDM